VRLATFLFRSKKSKETHNNNQSNQTSNIGNREKEINTWGLIRFGDLPWERGLLNRELIVL
jgi:hypothetical protein